MPLNKRLFDRTLRFSFTKDGQTITLPKELNSNVFANFDFQSGSNSMDIEIFNVAGQPDLFEILRGSTLRIEAGYGDNVLLLAEQEVVRANYVKERVTTTLILETEESYSFLKDTTISLSFSEDTPFSQVLSRVTEAFSLPVRLPRRPISTESFITGYSFEGKPFEALQELQNFEFFNFAFFNGELVILRFDDFLLNEKITLSKKDGFIKPPEFIEDIGFTAADDDAIRPGIKLTTFVLPQLICGIELEIENLSTTYRVESINHDLSSRSGNFATTIEAYATNVTPFSLLRDMRISQQNAQIPSSAQPKGPLSRFR